MKVTVLQENFYKRLSLALKFVASRPQLLVLANFLLEAKKGALWVMATNLDTGIRCRVGAKVEEEGGITVPAKTLTEFVGTLGVGRITLESSEEGLKVSAEQSQAFFQGVVASEFPAFPQLKEGKKIRLSRELLTEVVGVVGMAASLDEGRPVLTGILWEMGKQSVCVATDGYRLSRLHLSPKAIEKGIEIGEQLLVSAGVLREVERALTELEESSVSFLWSEQQLFFKASDVEVVARLLEGEFPNYRAIIPKQSTLAVSFNVAELIQAVKLTAIFARDSAHIVRWKLKGGVLEVSANSPSVGKNVSRVDFSGELEELAQIAFNSRYLLDLLSRIKAKEVRFSMTDSLKPGVFEEEGRGFLHLIMPVRVQG